MKNNRQIDFRTIEWDDICAAAKLSAFCPKGGAAEYHAMIRLTDRYLKAEEQFNNIETAIGRTNSLFGEDARCVFKRYFVSDAVNQANFLNGKNDDAAVSIVGQVPLDGTKVYVWAYFVSDCRLCGDPEMRIMERPAYKHLFSTQLQTPITDDIAETRLVFENYIRNLAKYNCTLKDNCIRTWIYVQGVDIHYTEMVNERKKIFEEEGLTPETHFIASTGIEGRHINPKSLVLMDTYGIDGIKQEQIRYLHAPTHLNPTHEYGVTFERATSVDYGDRRHIFVSGTASINNKGEIVHSSDIVGQIERTFENIGMLLKQADAQMDNVMQMIVYLRDIADCAVVSDYLEANYATTPYLLVLAPVCRPGWLVEIECIAIKAIENNVFEQF
ncbi:MAG: hypothetical protein LBH60_01595 [Prevotellaceae bacterium]|jgi:enamine deaminase RidA (YjgF/YER057c/UK114 family)|nr:hypothetical protein [Prevotellaceae bacterium]